MYQDNMSTIRLIGHKGNTGRMKHIALRYDFVREQVRLDNMKGSSIIFWPSLVHLVSELPSLSLVTLRLLPCPRPCRRPLLRPCPPGWVSGVLAVAGVGVRSVCVGGERYIYLRVTIIRGACCVRVGVVLLKILAQGGVVIVATI